VEKHKAGPAQRPGWWSGLHTAAATGIECYWPGPGRSAARVQEPSIADWGRGCLERGAALTLLLLLLLIDVSCVCAWHRFLPNEPLIGSLGKVAYV